MNLLFSANKTQQLIDPKKHPRPKSSLVTEDLRFNMVDRLKGTISCSTCGKNKV